MRIRLDRSALGALAAVVTAAAASACQGERISGLGEPVPVTVTMHRLGGGAAAPAVAGWLASVTGAQGSIDLATVDSIMVTLERIEVLPAVQEEGGEEGAGGWISLDLEPVRFNLLALPTATDAGFPLATGELPVGDYGNVRLFVSEVTLWLNTGFQLGQAFTFEPNVGYPVFVPSGDQTGIKTDQGFTIPEGGGDVVLVFHENATLSNVTGTGNGRVILAPVIRVSGGEQ